MRDFKQYTKIHAEPEDVYACLTNPFTIELWSGFPATMEAIEGAEFEMWDGDISGRILKLVENSEVVQEWYFGDQVEQSIVRFKIHPVKKGLVSVELNHSNIPDEAYDEIAHGWKEFYMGRIKPFLEL
jgi:activator of HSP90 ATPase